LASRAGATGPPEDIFAELEGELREEPVGSYLYQVHLHHELEFNFYDSSRQATMYI
jgi:hypothetical protein